MILFDGSRSTITQSVRIINDDNFEEAEAFTGRIMLAPESMAIAEITVPSANVNINDDDGRCGYRILFLCPRIHQNKTLVISYKDLVRHSLSLAKTLKFDQPFSKKWSENISNPDSASKIPMPFILSLAT